MKKNIIIILSIILIITIIGCDSKFNNKQQQQQQEQQQEIVTTTLYPVSINCTNAMQSLMDFSSPNQLNMMMISYSGIGYNELGNYDDCILLPSNVSQYCLFESNKIESQQSFYIGVCYPSSNVCSPDDIIGLMTQYTILELLQFKMNFSAVENLHCYNNNYQTVEIKGNSGTWVILAILGFIIINIIIGTLVEFIFIYKYKQFKKLLSYHADDGISNSLLNQQVNGFININDVDSGNSTGSVGSSSSSDKIKEPLPFYSFIFKLIPIDIYEKDSDSLFIKYTTSWSLIKNFKSLFYGSTRTTTTSNQKQHYFNSLDGIRSLSNIWVILGHTLYFAINSGFGIDNISTLENKFTSFSFQVMFAAVYAVDIFFMLSGFLISFSLITILDKQSSSSSSSVKSTSSRSIKFWVMFVLHRVIRLSPLYYFLIFFSIWVLPMIGSGPLFYQFQILSNQNCSENWWTNLLYINNFFNGQCYGWGVAWYLPNDMQFYMITPFLIGIFRRSKKWGSILVVFIIILSIGSNIIVSYYYDLPPAFDINSKISEKLINSSLFITDTYAKPYYRIASYLIGVLVSFIYTSTRLSKKVELLFQNRIIRYILYSISLFITFFLTYIPYSFYNGKESALLSGGLWNTLQKSLYNGFGHTLFVIGLSIFMFATFNGYGGMLKWFLELEIWKFFSKLTYSSYLVHLLVINFRIYSMTNFLHYSIIEFTFLFIGNLVTTFAFALIIHLIIEKPFINLERLIFKK